MMPQQKQSPGQALSKIKQYCSYQERCHEEVKQKLSDFGLSQYEIGQILGILIEENFLNEERFAIQFAGGKFRMKHWGKLKIRQELRQRKVSEYSIKIAISAIDEQAYQETLHKLASRKHESLDREKNAFLRKKKLLDYLHLKGYETDLVSDVVKQLPSKP